MVRNNRTAFLHLIFLQQCTSNISTTTAQAAALAAAAMATLAAAKHLLNVSIYLSKNAHNYEKENDVQPIRIGPHCGCGHDLPATGRNGLVLWHYWQLQHHCYRRWHLLRWHFAPQLLSIKAFVSYLFLTPKRHTLFGSFFTTHMPAQHYRPSQQPLPSLIAAPQTLPLPPTGGHSHWPAGIRGGRSHTATAAAQRHRGLLRGKA